MLTEKTVELITDFEGWEYPNLHKHKFDIEGVLYTSVDKWSDWGLGGYYEDRVLNKDEQKCLEELLIQNPKSEIYEVVSEFIEWVSTNFPFDGYDYKDHMVYFLREEYYHLGRRTSSIDGTSIENDLFFTHKDCLQFWDKHYKIEYFEKTLPHYVESLRRLLFDNRQTVSSVSTIPLK